MCQERVHRLERIRHGKSTKRLLKEKMKALEWAFERTQEGFDFVAQNEARKVSVVQEIMLRSTDYFRRIIATAGGQGRVTMSLLPALQQVTFWTTAFWWVSG